MTLSFENDAQLEQSTNFLKLAHPLNYTAAVKKSQVRDSHQPLCTGTVAHFLPRALSCTLE